jgi:hypothetical protein
VRPWDAPTPVLYHDKKKPQICLGCMEPVQTSPFFISRSLSLNLGFNEHLQRCSVSDTFTVKLDEENSNHAGLVQEIGFGFVYGA